MDRDGIPIVGPNIDFTKVGAINHKRTLAFLNHFITHTVRFLNRFSCVCEEKLEALSIRIQRIEITMNLLEAKLASIPGLEDVTVPTTSTSSAAQAPQADTNQAQEANQQPTDTTNEETPTEAATQPVAPVEAKPKKTVSQDPRYAKYFSLLKVGVPVAAFQGKMLAEGLDPDLLETPDAPTDAQSDSSDDEEGSSASSFSDDDD